jgi:cytochrome P450
MNDPEYWRDPEVFNPERFLDDRGKFTPDERVVPFGTGRRVCPGQILAEKELFLFFAGIMQGFQMVPGGELPGYGVEETNPKGLIRQPPTFEVVLMSRA